MWTAGVVGGLLVAAVTWLLFPRLAPDSRGQSFESLTRTARWTLGTVALAGGAAGAAAVAAVLPERPAAVGFAVFAAVSPGLAVIDGVTHRLPFIVTGALAAVAVIGFGWDAVLSDESGSLTRAGWASVIVGSLALAWWRAFDGGVGLGDVALLAVIGGFAGWLSWATVWVAVAAGFVLAALGAGVDRWGLGRVGGYLPLGPFLLAGWWAAFALAVAG